MIDENGVGGVPPPHMVAELVEAFGSKVFIVVHHANQTAQPGINLGGLGLGQRGALINASKLPFRNSWGNCNQTYLHTTSDMPRTPGELTTRSDCTSLGHRIAHELGHVIGLPHRESLHEMAPHEYLNLVNARSGSGVSGLGFFTATDPRIPTNGFTIVPNTTLDSQDVRQLITSLPYN